MADIVCQFAIPTQIAQGQAAIATITLHNRSNQTLHLLKRNTPFEGWLADSLSVDRDGQAVAYIGAVAKRMPPSGLEYLHLKPGTRYSYRASLQNAYDVSASGRYRVNWRGEVMDAYFGSRKPNTDHMTAQTIACGTVSFVRTP